MGKKLLVLVSLFICVIAQAYDIVNVNMDKETIGWVTTNTATEAATNELHNEQVDSIKKKQSKLAKLITTIAAEKDLIIQTYQNVSGFKKESKYYIMIAKTGADIIEHSGQAIEVIENAKIEGKAMAVIKISELVSNAISLGKAFSDIVADCEVPNPLKQKETSHKDKHNLLNRYERLFMANDILFRLRSIDNSLKLLIYMTKTASWKTLLFTLDRKTYITYIMTQVNTNDMIRKWNRIQN